MYSDTKSVGRVSVAADREKARVAGGDIMRLCRLLADSHALHSSHDFWIKDSMRNVGGSTGCSAMTTAVSVSISTSRTSSRSTCSAGRGGRVVVGRRIVRVVGRTSSRVVRLSSGVGSGRGTATVSRTTGRGSIRGTSVSGRRVVCTVVHRATAGSGIRIAAGLRRETAISLLLAKALVLTRPWRHGKGGLRIIIRKLVCKVVVTIAVVSAGCLLGAST
jgi:hypothetical protein